MGNTESSIVIHGLAYGGIIAGSKLIVRFLLSYGCDFWKNLTSSLAYLLLSNCDAAHFPRGGWIVLDRTKRSQVIFLLNQRLMLEDSARCASEVISKEKKSWRAVVGMI